MGWRKKIEEDFSFLKWLDPFTYVDLYVMPVVNPNEHELKAWVVYIVFAFIFAFIIYSLFGFLLGTDSPMVIVVSNSMIPNLYRGDVIVMQGVPEEYIFVQESELDYFSLDGMPMGYYAYTMCSKNGSEQLKNCKSFITEAVLGDDVSISSFSTRKIVLANNDEIDIDQTGDIVVYDSDLQNRPIIHRVVAKIRVKDGVYLFTKGDSEFNPLIDQQAGIASSAINVKDIKGKAILRIPLIGYIKLLLVDDIKYLLFGCPKGQECMFP